ncbi:MAG: dephospho-CoA kinase [Bacteroidales bacterium]|nr:dephospho-CoA kinase [Bacteroidales bacterium]
MKTIAVTGGIGSGKSVVTRIFQTLGFPVYDSDQAVKRLYHEDTVLKEALCRDFGNDLYREGRLDTAALAAKVFDDPEQLEQLNALAHPAVARDFLSWCKKQLSDWVVFESAILFQSRLGLSFDVTIAVTAPDDLRLRRVLRRPGMTPALVRQRMARQLPQEELIRLADHTVCNDEKSALLPQIQHIISQIV